MTFEARPLCNLTRCTALWKSDIPIKLDIMIAKASHIDGLNFFVNLCLIVYMTINLELAHAKYKRTDFMVTVYGFNLKLSLYYKSSNRDIFHFISFYHMTSLLFISG